MHASARRHPLVFVLFFVWLVRVCECVCFLLLFCALMHALGAGGLVFKCIVSDNCISQAFEAD